MKREVLILVLEFQKEYKKYKRQFKIPQCKDFSKTYQYRWFKSFYDKCYKIYSLQDTVEILKCVVRYAKQNNMLHIGASLLNKSDVVEIACKIFNDDISNIDNVISELKNNMKIVTSNFKVDLLKKSHRDGYCDLIMMYLDGRINLNFISLSKSCISLLPKLKENRELFPKSIDIVKRRYKLIGLLGNDKIKKIMGDEYAEC